MNNPLRCSVPMDPASRARLPLAARICAHRSGTKRQRSIGRDAPPGCPTFGAAAPSQIDRGTPAAKPARQRIVNGTTRMFGAGSTTVAKRSMRPHRRTTSQRSIGRDASPRCPTFGAAAPSQIDLGTPCRPHRRTTRIVPFAHVTGNIYILFPPGQIGRNLSQARKPFR